MNERPDDIHPVTWRVLCALRAGTKLSRNKNFTLFKDPMARRGLRLFRYLRSVAEDIKHFGEELSVESVGSEDEPADFALRIEFPLIHGKRTAYLRAGELELLAQDEPEVARLIVSQLAT